ncbi:MAG: hypothetical protein UW63_C0078G0008 [Candidatus Uhrbacteria bacterium GW2011_GWF2_44_350]|uniref:Uncharacterized protein n=1 Tax=Candidatus Uhrbacteria bacterium GW2011_GWF2_44_350 TaxID=1619000 RepID=A0A0G1LHZ9_9BACT|nr:MAG: hypothetical protein UW63_C0078G0008 [Candidatus Uhrbacteria bacterium GW2011_GWF2_44_350]
MSAQAPMFLYYDYFSCIIFSEFKFYFFNYDFFLVNRLCSFARGFG